MSKPSKVSGDAASMIEYLKSEQEHGRGNEKLVLVHVQRDMKERIENSGGKPKTKFAIETDSPAVYSDLNRSKDRVIAHCKNKAVALTLLCWAWRQLDEGTMDKLMAIGEKP